MSNVIHMEFPRDQGSRNVVVEWKIHARRRSDFAVVETSLPDEREAIETARRLFSQGYDITVHKHLIQKMAEWVYDEDWNDD